MPVGGRGQWRQGGPGQNREYTPPPELGDGGGAIAVATSSCSKQHSLVNEAAMKGAGSLLQGCHDDGRDEEDGCREEGSSDGSLPNSSPGSYHRGPHLFSRLIQHHHTLPQFIVPHQHRIQSTGSRCNTHTVSVSEEGKRPPTNGGERDESLDHHLGLRAPGPRPLEQAIESHCNGTSSCHCCHIPLHKPPSRHRLHVTNDITSIE